MIFSFKNDSNPLCRDQLNFLNLMWHDFEWHFSHFNPDIIVLCISIKSTYAKRKNIMKGAIIISVLRVAGLREPKAIVFTSREYTVLKVTT